MASVHVIIPCYQYGHLLEECVESVLSQEDVEVRVIIMDDASPDDTEAIGRRLAQDPRVEYRRHAVNRGHIATYNEALADVTADYCMILSADDLLTPRALSRATRAMDAHPDVGLAYGRDITFRHTPPREKALGGRHCPHKIMGYGEFLAHACRTGHTSIQAPTAIVRTTLHHQIGGYLPELPHSGDTEIWLRMAAHADVCALDADQAFRRLHAINMSLDYSPVRRIEAQKRAFDIHFAAYRATRPEIAAGEPVLNRTIAESAFWGGALAFDAGDLRACEEFLALASATCPDIESWDPWRRLRWKRRVGRTAYRLIEPIAARIRNGIRARSGDRRAAAAPVPAKSRA
jgi:glycosyltransferase involved in cell wall biosynthesis